MPACSSPIQLCDTLLALGEAETFEPLWSAEILDEVGRNLVGRLGLSDCSV